MSSSPPDLTVDADVLMNLLASDHIEAILAANGHRGLVCPRTEAEAIYLNPRSPGLPRERIDIEQLVAAGVLARTVLDAAETSTFVRLAALVDDGEAQVLAVAVHRALPVATDDRKARRLAIDLGLSVLSTPELVMAWASRATAAESAAAVLDVEVRANYRPRAADPLRSEWDRLKAG